MSWYEAAIGVGLSIFDAWNKTDEADKQSDVAEKNAAAMQKEADYQAFRTSVLLHRQRETTVRLLSAQRAAFAHNGIQVDTGTALNIAEQTATQSMEDRALIRQEGQFNYDRALLGVSMYQQQADDITKSGYIEAGSTILTGVWDFTRDYLTRK